MSVSVTSNSILLCLFFFKFFIWIIASLIECCPPLLHCAPPGMNLTHAAFTMVLIWSQVLCCSKHSQGQWCHSPRFTALALRAESWLAIHKSFLVSAHGNLWATNPSHPSIFHWGAHPHCSPYWEVQEWRPTSSYLAGFILVCSFSSSSTSSRAPSSPYSVSQVLSIQTQSSKNKELCWGTITPREVGQQESSESILFLSAFPSLFWVSTRLYSPLHASLELAGGSRRDLGPSFVWCHSCWCSFSAQSLAALPISRARLSSQTTAEGRSGKEKSDRNPPLQSQ